MIEPLEAFLIQVETKNEPIIVFKYPPSKAALSGMVIGRVANFIDLEVIKQLQRVKAKVEALWVKIDGLQQFI